MKFRKFSSFLLILLSFIATSVTALANSDTPPSLDNISLGDSNSTAGNSSSLKINSPAATPSSFNPGVSAGTNIAFTLSAPALVDVLITNTTDATIKTILSDRNVSEANKTVYAFWDGKHANGSNIAPGQYLFKIIAKNPTTKDLLATTTGPITIVGGGTPTTPVNPTTPTPGDTSMKKLATTGLPVAGYALLLTIPFLARRFTKK